MLTTPYIRPLGGGKQSFRSLSCIHDSARAVPRGFTREYQKDIVESIRFDIWFARLPPNI